MCVASWRGWLEPAPNASNFEPRRPSDGVSRPRRGASAHLRSACFHAVYTILEGGFPGSPKLKPRRGCKGVYTFSTCLCLMRVASWRGLLAPASPETAPNASKLEPCHRSDGVSRPRRGASTHLRSTFFHAVYTISRRRISGVAEQTQKPRRGCQGVYTFWTCLFLLSVASWRGLLEPASPDTAPNASKLEPRRRSDGVPRPRCGASTHLPSTPFGHRLHQFGDDGMY